VNMLPIERFMAAIGPLDRGSYQLGRLCLQIESNDLDQICSYLHPCHRVEGAPIHWLATFIKVPDGALEEIVEHRVRCYRSERLLAGHYLGHHIGKPAVLVKHSAKETMVVSADPGRIFWTFFLKFALTVHHLEQGMLHLKAAAVARAGRATLFVGRGGAGKSTIVRALCRRGAALVSNTHCLVGAGMVQGLATAVRARAGSSERFVSATDFVGSWNVESHPIGSIVFLSGKAPTFSVIRMPPLSAAVLAQQFAAAIGNYDLKEDVADYCGTLHRTAELLQRELALVRDHLERLPAALIELDADDEHHLDLLERTLDTLGRS
jgi:hypothetical protein